MKALVTGGAGFIGSNVVETLSQRGYQVIVLDNLTTGYLENLRGINNVRFIKGDIRNTELLEEIIRGDSIKTIYHLAGTVGNLKSIEFPEEDAEVNVIGTLRLLDLIRKYKVKKLVFSSSSAIFGELQYLPIDEKHPVEPDSPYGVTKLAGEKHCLCYSRLYGIAVVCLRYFNVYGKNQRYDPYGNVIPIWTDNLLSGRPLKIFGDGSQTRDFINVADVALANVMAGEAENLSGVFNIGTGEALSINELAELYKDIHDKSMDVIYAPARKGEVKHSRAEISKAAGAFGFRAAVNIKDGIKTYIDWVRESCIPEKANV